MPGSLAGGTASLNPIELTELSSSNRKSARPTGSSASAEASGGPRAQRQKTTSLKRMQSVLTRSRLLADDDGDGRADRAGCGSIFVLACTFVINVLIVGLNFLEFDDEFMLSGPIKLGASLNFSMCAFLSVPITFTLCFTQMLMQVSRQTRIAFGASPSDEVRMSFVRVPTPGRQRRDSAAAHGNAFVEIVHKAKTLSNFERLHMFSILFNLFLVFFSLRGMTTGTAGSLEHVLTGDPGEMFFIIAVLVLWPIAYYMLKNFRQGMVRSHQSDTTKYVQDISPVIVGIMAFQILMYAFSSAPYVRVDGLGVTDNRETVYEPCEAINASYIETFCELDFTIQPYAEQFGAPFYKCEGETYGAYNSLFAACRAAMMYNGFAARAWPALIASIHALMMLLFYEYTHGVDSTLTWRTSRNTWYYKSTPRLRAAISLAFGGLFIEPGLVLLILLPGAGKLLAFTGLLNNVANFCWFSAFVMLTVEFIFEKYVAAKPDFEIIHEKKKKKMSEVLTDLVKQHQSETGHETKFANNDPKELVTGQPTESAHGVNHFMKCPGLQMPRIEPLGDRLWEGDVTKCEGIAAIVREFESHMATDEDRECLNYVLRMEAGSSDIKFPNGDLMRDCDAAGNLLPERTTMDGKGMLLKDFVNHPDSRTAKLEPPHVLALRLYTTAAFRSYNTPLRQTSKDRERHPFPITINYLAEGIRRFRAVEAEKSSKATQEVDLWRGMKYMYTSDNFKHSGGTELAPMSTTTDLRVAVQHPPAGQSCARSRRYQYSMSPSSLIFKIKTKGFMDRGANLQYLSAFPAEAEVLYPPLTFLQPTDLTATAEIELPATDTTEKQVVKFKVIEVEPKFSS